MKAFVVDTNVPVVANGRSEQADRSCVLSCIEKLEEIHSRGIVVLDDRMRILKEYMDNLSMSGQPGPGDSFMKWIWTQQANVQRCERVSITESGDTFDEIPDEPGFIAFDRSDRKFLAVAMASSLNPTVVNAVDPDWAECHVALVHHGVRVEFLCPQHVTPV